LSIVIIYVQRDYMTGNPEVYGYDEDEDTLEDPLLLTEPITSYRGPAARRHRERVLARKRGREWYVVPTLGADPVEWEARFEDALDAFLERMSAQARRAAGIVDVDAIEEPLELPAPRLMLPPAGGTCDAR